MGTLSVNELVKGKKNNISWKNICGFRLRFSLKTIDICNQWPFQDHKLEGPTIYKAYVRP